MQAAGNLRHERYATDMFALIHTKKDVWKTNSFWMRIENVRNFQNVLPKLTFRADQNNNGGNPKGWSINLCVWCWCLRQTGSKNGVVTVAFYKCSQRVVNPLGGFSELWRGRYPLISPESSLSIGNKRRLGCVLVCVWGGWRAFAFCNSNKDTDCLVTYGTLLAIFFFKKKRSF